MHAIACMHKRIPLSACTIATTSAKAEFQCGFLGYHRKGSARYENSGEYKGDWLREQRSGWGMHTFANGDAYEGEWLHDKIQGPRLHQYQSDCSCPAHAHAAACCNGEDLLEELLFSFTAFKPMTSPNRSH